MFGYHHHSAPLSRGTIIVDGAALEHLCGSIAPSLKADGITPVTYLSTLHFLAKHGYRIVVPEMVSIDAASTIAGGYDFTHLFTQRSGVLKSEARLKSFMHDAGLDERNTLKEHPGITVLGATGPGMVDAFCTRVHEAISLKDKKTVVWGRVKAPERLPKPHTEARRAIINAFREDRTDFALQSVLSLAKRLALTGEKNLVVLSDTRALLAEVTPPAQTCNTGLFLQGLSHAGLLEQAGFKAGITAGEVLWDQLESGKKLGTYADTSQPYTEKSRIETPFVKSLQKLAAELDTAPPPPSVSSDGSAIEKFTKRYARFGRTR
ncbi:MAG: hypothetical protein ACOYNL_09485 [Rickettsiales bacterium]